MREGDVLKKCSEEGVQRDNNDPTAKDVEEEAALIRKFFFVEWGKSSGESRRKVNRV